MNHIIYGYNSFNYRSITKLNFLIGHPPRGIYTTIINNKINRYLIIPTYLTINTNLIYLNALSTAVTIVKSEYRLDSNHYKKNNRSKNKSDNKSYLFL